MSVRSYIKGVTLASLALSAFVACTGTRETKNIKNIDAQSILDDAKLSNKEKAEKLALAGEQLITPSSFFHASDVLDAALEQDPENKRAQLYKAIINPMMKMKGIYKRVEPLVENDEKDHAKYLTQIEKNKLGWGNQALQDFLLDGQKDITSEAEAAKFLDEVNAEYAKSREFFNKNISMEMVINLNHDMWRRNRNDLFNKNISTDMVTDLNLDMWKKERSEISRVDKCTYTKVSDLSYEVECEEGFVKPDRQKINRGEMEALKAISTGMQTYSLIMSSYNLDGIIDIVRVLRRNKEEYRNDKDKVPFILSQNNNIGNLRNIKALNDVLALGLDGMAGLRWVQKNVDTLCPLPEEGSKFYKEYNNNLYYYYEGEPRQVPIRREGYLIDRGLCVDKFNAKGVNVHKIIDVVEMAFKGNAVAVRGRTKSHHKNFDGSIVWLDQRVAEVEMNFASFLKSPLESVRDLPETYNDCGMIESFSDDTLGGVFPNGDANKHLSDTGYINKMATQCAGI